MVVLVGTLSRRLCRCLFSASPKIYQISVPFSASISSHEGSDHENSDLDNESVPDASQQSAQSSSPEGLGGNREIYERPLENGLDVGIYKAIIVGQVGQSPIKKKLRSGRSVTLFSIGTGGIRNNFRSLENEEPRDYANRCAVQWHRVSVYPERLGDIAVKHALPGSIIYLEGNLETTIFTDPITGLVRWKREIAIRRSGRLVFLCKSAEDVHQPSPSEFKSVGYYY